MFTKPTVFVLGAGISAPFGFPVGRQMKDAICNGGFQPYGANYCHTEQPSLMAELLAIAMGNPNQTTTAMEFLTAFRASDIYSIDAWLEANQHDTQVLKMGKHAIAAVIIHAETISIGQGSPVEQDWFAWLWNNIWTPKIEDLENNWISFVTFNYDRLLEWKLWRQIKHTYLRNTDEEHKKAFNFLRKRIVHAHSALSLPETDDHLLTYGQSTLNRIDDGMADTRQANKKTYAERMRVLSDSINIVCETPTKDNILIDGAKRLIQQKDAKIIFLGFSYDKRNVLKLDLDKYAQEFGNHLIGDLNQRLTDSRIVGTAMGIKRGERSKAEEMFHRRIALAPHDMDAVEFCRTYLDVR